MRRDPTTRLLILGTGSVLALVGAFWYLSLLLDIDQLQHVLEGSRGGLIAQDGVLALFVALPITVVGVIVAFLGSPPGEPTGKRWRRLGLYVTVACGVVAMYGVLIFFTYSTWLVPLGALASAVVLVGVVASIVPVGHT